ncbi:MAG TPA: Maf family protein [Candidatus Binataceae bacterium]|nr:Maf family protein [Candidatus Binataceae bacterium]
MTSSSQSQKLILASGSPRRRQLLTAAGLSFEAIESAIPERRKGGESALDYAPRMARDKAFAIAARFPEAIVLGADTVVECVGQVLEKPVDENDARRMLTMLAGRTHTVVTAFAIARGVQILAAEAVESRVTFRTLSAAEIDEYIAGGEPFDKAGAYGIQGVGGSFISAVDGPRDNVMGLPVDNVLAALRRVGFERC